MCVLDQLVESGERERGRYALLAGELALARKDSARAIQHLTAAERTLPKNGRLAGTPTLHVPVWFALGSAYAAGGDDAKALEWLGRVSECGIERLHWPIPYVRSLYLLGKIHQRRGNPGKARAYFENHERHWKDGDLKGTPTSTAGMPFPAR